MRDVSAIGISSPLDRASVSECGMSFRQSKHDWLTISRDRSPENVQAAVPRVFIPFGVIWMSLPRMWMIPGD